MRRLGGLCAALGFVAFCAVTPVAAAHASADVGGRASITAFGDCPAGWFCVWMGSGGTGTMGRFRISVPDLGSMRVSSLWNRTGVVWCAYPETDYRGNPVVVGDWRGNPRTQIHSLLGNC